MRVMGYVNVPNRKCFFLKFEFRTHQMKSHTQNTRHPINKNPFIESVESFRTMQLNLSSNNNYYSESLLMIMMMMKNV